MNVKSNFRFVLPATTGLIIIGMFFSCATGKKDDNQTKSKNKMKIESKKFGNADGHEVLLYTLENSKGMKVTITNYGGIITSVYTPDKNGKFDDVVLGFDNLQSYLDGHPYFGALVGRYGNRIAKGKFVLEGHEYSLAVNNGENHLHGGLIGFDKKVWDAEPFEKDDAVGLKLHYLSRDMEEGYPGNLDVQVTYTLTDENELKIEYRATTDKSTPVNLTSHSYFNLTGGKENVMNHEVEINADRYIVVNESLIPTGELRSCAGTAMDFSKIQSIGSRFDQVDGGYDHCYVLNKKSQEISLAAKVKEPKSGRTMEVWTTEPGVQFYTGNFLDGTLTGINGVVYKKNYGFCFEAQHFPDSPNQPDFPSSVLKPGETYKQTTIYKFSVQ
jgi:aldose 1-epimerase